MRAEATSRDTADRYRGSTASAYKAWLQSIDPKTGGLPAYTSYISAKVDQQFNTGWGVGVVCCITADPHQEEKTMTRTPSPAAFYPTKSLPFSIIWEFNTESVVDLHRMQLCMLNFERGLHKAPLAALPPTSN